MNHLSQSKLWISQSIRHNLPKTADWIFKTAPYNKFWVCLSLLQDLLLFLWYHLGIYCCSCDIILRFTAAPLILSWCLLLCLRYYLIVYCWYYPVIYSCSCETIFVYVTVPVILLKCLLLFLWYYLGVYSDIIFAFTIVPVFYLSVYFYYFDIIFIFIAVPVILYWCSLRFLWYYLCVYLGVYCSSCAVMWFHRTASLTV